MTGKKTAHILFGLLFTASVLGGLFLLGSYLPDTPVFLSKGVGEDSESPELSPFNLFSDVSLDDLGEPLYPTSEEVTGIPEEEGVIEILADCEDCSVPLSLVTGRVVAIEDSRFSLSSEGQVYSVTLSPTTVVAVSDFYDSPGQPLGFYDMDSGLSKDEILDKVQLGSVVLAAGFLQENSMVELVQFFLLRL